MALTLNTMKTKRILADEGDTVTGICMDAVVELQRACHQFPNFPDELTLRSADGIRAALQPCRNLNDTAAGEYANAESVIMEEFYEFLEAAVDRDPAKARKELVQTIALLLRTYVHLEHYTRPV